MKEIRFVKICEYLCRLIEKREHAPEEMISEFMSELAKSMQKKVKKQDFSYYDLADRCRKYQTYQMEEREQFAYMMGNIMGAASLYQQFCLEAELQTYEEKILAPDTMLFAALSIIVDYPGISRQELYEKIPGDRSSSALSHLTGLLKRDHYIKAQKVGQEKRFFATPRGDEFIRMSLQNRKAVQNQQSAALESNMIAKRPRVSIRETEDYDSWNELFNEILKKDLIDSDYVSNTQNDLLVSNYN